MKILFVCTGNTCRSIMAEAIFNYYMTVKCYDGRAKSAGLAALDGHSATEFSIEAMKEMGIDISSHRSRSLEVEMLREADLVLTMTDSQKRLILLEQPDIWGKTHTLKQLAGMGEEDIQDPFGQSLDVYRSCAREIQAAVLEAIKRIFGEE